MRDSEVVVGNPDINDPNAAFLTEPQMFQCIILQVNCRKIRTSLNFPAIVNPIAVLDYLAGVRGGILSISLLRIAASQ